jgi:hypothetical protein
LLVENDCLTIEDGREHTELARGGFYQRKAVRPVAAASREDPDTPRLYVNGKTVAVPLDLKSPLLALWRFVLREGKTRLYPFRHWIEGRIRLRRIVRLAWSGSNRLIGFAEKRL